MKTLDANPRGAWVGAMMMGGLMNWILGGDLLASMLFAAVLAAGFMPRE